jgi:hypothetical protein
MGGFGSRGGVFLMAPVRRRVPSDTPPVWVSKCGTPHPGLDPGTNLRTSSRREDGCETLRTCDTDLDQDSEPRSEP